MQRPAGPRATTISRHARTRRASTSGRPDSRGIRTGAFEGKNEETQGKDRKPSRIAEPLGPKSVRHMSFPGSIPPASTIATRGCGVTPTYCYYSSQHAFVAANSGFPVPRDAVVSCHGGAVVASEDGGRGCGGGFEMLGGCHWVIPLGVDSIVRRGWGDVKEKLRATNREHGRSSKLQALGQAHRSRSSRVTRHREPSRWVSRSSLGVRGEGFGVRRCGAWAPVLAQGDGTYGTNGTNGTRADRASAGAGAAAPRPLPPPSGLFVGWAARPGGLRRRLGSVAPSGLGRGCRRLSRRLTPLAMLFRRFAAGGSCASRRRCGVRSPRGRRRPASCSFHSGSSRTAALAAGGRWLLRGAPATRPKHRPSASAERCTGHRKAARHTQRQGRPCSRSLSAGFPAAIRSRHRPRRAA